MTMQKNQDTISEYLEETKQIIDKLDKAEIRRMVGLLQNLKGRLFILGVGGSAANASHAVNDFRKIAGIEAYAPTDNVAELTARTNDDGWESTFVEWLKISNLDKEDALMIFSVGGGSTEASRNIVEAIFHAKAHNAKVMGIVSRNGGYTLKMADSCILIPTINPDHITPHAEALQGILWHIIVNNI